ncbi:hypothetical protein EVAR_44099_1 [Eumeta japonica]|uniref:Uncharacterized protein n=1 Tax=Eumeta variegata TaxID=151549 RepID=A0A4C1X0T1_EUMVA|nr:hypothetical protein EVAR_44099_1 [Eumeta japonica]
MSSLEIFILQIRLYSWGARVFPPALAAVRRSGRAGHKFGHPVRGRETKINRLRTGLQVVAAPVLRRSFATFMYCRPPPRPRPLPSPLLHHIYLNTASCAAVASPPYRAVKNPMLMFIPLIV